MVYRTLDSGVGGRIADAALAQAGLGMLRLPLVTLVGPRAMISYKPRQARKGATVVADSCAVVRLAGATSFSSPPDASRSRQNGVEARS
jgi:hypothetical protein